MTIGSFEITNTLTLEQYINSTIERDGDRFYFGKLILKRDEVFEIFTGDEIVENVEVITLLSNPPKYSYIVELK